MINTSSSADTETGAALLIYDGDCGFCTTTAMWIEARLTSADVAPWQALDLDQYGLTIDDVTTAAYWIDEAGASHRGERGIALALQNAPQPWRVAGRAMAVPPLSWLAAPVYRLIAKYRYQMPGSTDACRLPQADAE